MSNDGKSATLSADDPRIANSPAQDHVAGIVRTLQDQNVATKVASRVSIISPIFNEEENVPIFVGRLIEACTRLGRPYEIIAVNDGSSDRSDEILRGLAAKHPELKIVNFRRNYGQTAAMQAGIEYAEGEIIVSIDSDLQNDPDDIPLLLSKLEEGYDVVSGWRKDRKDAAIRRNLLSRIANAAISTISGVHLHDYGCTLKAYRRDVIKGVRLYGEMHRFIPIYATWRGAKVIELPVQHHPRSFGASKYGLERTFKVILDLIVVKFLDRYLVKPIYVFGGFGLISLAISSLSGLYMLYLKLIEGISMIATPLPLLTAMTFLIGIVSILMGLLAELVMRTYFESQQLMPYHVRDVINLKPRTGEPSSVRDDGTTLASVATEVPDGRSSLCR